MRQRIDPDEYDLAQLREACESPGFAQFAERIKKTHDLELANLALATKWEDVVRTQGFLEGLKLALQIPTILAKEIRSRSEKKRKTTE